VNNWQSEIWSCWYCGSYNEQHLYYCPRCNAKRKEEKRLNRPDPYEHVYDTPYFAKSGVSFRTPATYYYTTDIRYKGAPISSLNQRALAEIEGHIEREISKGLWYR
jgi:hypothetical protein